MSFSFATTDNTAHGRYLRKGPREGRHSFPFPAGLHSNRQYDSDQCWFPNEPAMVMQRATGDSANFATKWSKLRNQCCWHFIYTNQAKGQLKSLPDHPVRSRSRPIGRQVLVVWRSDLYFRNNGIYANQDVVLTTLGYQLAINCPFEF